MSTPPVVRLLVNPASGRGRSRRLIPRVRAGLADALPDRRIVVLASASWAHARELAERAVADAGADDCLVVMGGDGMASVGLNACAGTDVPLGIVPAGTGNDFCRGVGLPARVPEAVRVIGAGHTRRIDLMVATGDLADGTGSRYVGSVVSTGFDERVNERTNNLPFSVGAPSYVYALFAEGRSFRPLRYRIRVDDGPVRELDALLIAVGNAGVIGGGIRICPDADVTDGLLDVTVVHPVGWLTLLKEFRALFSGRFTRNPAIEQLRARSVVVDGDGLRGMADGESLGPVPLDLAIRPLAVRVFAPFGEPR